MFDLVREEDPDAGGVDGSGIDAKMGCWAVGEDGDEDQDLLPDGCDQCPQDVDATVVDTDGDGVGEQCDPDPDGAVNRIVMFDGFAKDASWNATSGTWMRTDGNRGEYVQLLPVGNTYAELTTKPVHFPAVDVRFTLDACQTGCGAGAQITYPSLRAACLYEYRNSSDIIALYVNDQEAMTMPFDASGAIRIQLSSTSSGEINCTVFSGGATEVVFTTVVVPEATTKVGLVTKADSARFQSILVIARL